VADADPTADGSEFSLHRTRRAYHRAAAEFRRQVAARWPPKKVIPLPPGYGAAVGVVLGYLSNEPEAVSVRVGEAVGGRVVCVTVDQLLLAERRGGA
jgi:hypothetical protein